MYVRDNRSMMNSKITNKTPASALRRSTKKKCKDKPKRPLSAYNYFFKAERERILKIMSGDLGDEFQNEPDSADYIDDETIQKLKKEGGKVSFEEMGRLIGQRWKSIAPDKLSTFTAKASADTTRYKSEMEKYNGQQEARLKSEAIRLAQIDAEKKKEASRLANASLESSGQGAAPEETLTHGTSDMYAERMSSLMPSVSSGSYGYGDLGYYGYGNMGMNAFGGPGMNRTGGFGAMGQGQISNFSGVGNSLLDSGNPGVDGNNGIALHYSSQMGTMGMGAMMGGRYEANNMAGLGSGNRMDHGGQYPTDQNLGAGRGMFRPPTTGWGGF